MAWTSLLRVADAYCVERDCRPLETRGTGTRDPTPGEPSSKEINPEEIEQRARLFRLVETLPDDQRRVIEMRFAQEKSINEIARELGRTDGAIKQLQFRGLESLRSQFEVSARKSTASKSAGKAGRLNG
jgi:RNA polymerase sigma factor (sigma-70 family)